MDSNETEHFVICQRCRKYKPYRENSIIAHCLRGVKMRVWNVLLSHWLESEPRAGLLSWASKTLSFHESGELTHQRVLKGGRQRNAWQLTFKRNGLFFCFCMHAHSEAYIYLRIPENSDWLRLYVSHMSRTVHLIVLTHCSGPKEEQCRMWRDLDTRYIER